MMTYFLRFCYIVYEQNATEKWKKKLHPPHPEKGYLRIKKSNRGINHSSIADNVYDILLLNHMKLNIFKNSY